MSNKYTAQRGYGQVQRETASDKHIELQLFSKITARLRAASSGPAVLIEINESIILGLKAFLKGPDATSSPPPSDIKQKEFA